jgi:hypothetical protein
MTHESIDQPRLPRADYEKLTDEEFEDDTDYKDKPKEIREFLFEGAPHP